MREIRGDERARICTSTWGRTGRPAPSRYLPDLPRIAAPGDQTGDGDIFVRPLPMQAHRGKCHGLTLGGGGVGEVRKKKRNLRFLNHLIAEGSPTSVRLARCKSSIEHDTPKISYIPVAMLLENVTRCGHFAGGMREKILRSYR